MRIEHSATDPDSTSEPKPKPKRSREDNLRIIAACNEIIEELRRKRDQLPNGI